MRALPHRAASQGSRPVMTFEGYTYISAADPLFVHQAALDRAQVTAGQ
jgi:hypothetical protein